MEHIEHRWNVFPDKGNINAFIKKSQTISINKKEFITFRDYLTSGGNQCFHQRKRIKKIKIYLRLKIADLKTS